MALRCRSIMCHYDVKPSIAIYVLYCKVLDHLQNTSVIDAQNKTPSSNKIEGYSRVSLWDVTLVMLKLA
jgi:hypothetical protein